VRRIVFILLFSCSIGYADCTVSDVVGTLRPGAEWYMRGDDQSTLVWMSTQTIPSKSEVVQAMAECRSAKTTRMTQKQQARLDVKNTGLTPAQRLQALLILLDYDQ